MAGWEACATTLGCWRVSARIVARLQRLMATVAANPGRCPGLSCGGLSGLVFAPPFWKKEAMDLARIFHSHLGKGREKPYEKRGANTFECVVETTRHAGLETCEPKLGLPTAGWEACATTLDYRRVSRRMVARLQRLMAIMASKPRALPWAVLWRPFRPCIRTAMLEEESHGFSPDIS